MTRTVEHAHGGVASDVLNTLRKGMPETASEGQREIPGYAPDPYIRKMDRKSYTAKINGRAMVIHITNRAVRQDASDALVPIGSRKITVQEGAMAWLQNIGFRRDLSTNNGVWTGERGIKTTGPHRIEDDGTFKKGAPNGRKRMAWHYPGEGVIGLDGDTMGGVGKWLLYVDADIKGWELYRVAYTSKALARA